MERCGFDYAVVGGSHCALIIGEERVNIWQWSREVHETRLRRAGLDDIRWHPLEAPPDARPEVMRAMGVLSGQSELHRAERHQARLAYFLAG